MAAYENLSIYGKINYIFQWICFIIAIIGVLSNILSVIVLSRRNLLKHSFAFYIRMMNMFDMFVLITSFRHWAAFVLGQDLTVVSVFFCKLSEYAVVASSSSSAWHLFLVNVDRLVTIVFPQRFLIFKKKRFQALLSFTAAAYSFCIYLPLSIYRDLVTIESFDSKTNVTSRSTTCAIIENKDLLFYLINFVNTITVAVFLNNILTATIIVFIFKSRNKFGNSAKNGSAAVKDRKFAINSVALNLASITFRVPLLTAMIVTTYLNLDGEMVGMIFTVCVAIHTIDSSGAFVINYLVNSIFYTEFWKLVGKKRIESGSKVQASKVSNFTKESNKF